MIPEAEPSQNGPREASGHERGAGPGADLRQATLAALHELTERLTAITNYLEAALRLSQTHATAANIPPRHTELLEKAFGQVSQADEVIKRLRRLMEEEARRDGTPAAGE